MLLVIISVQRELGCKNSTATFIGTLHIGMCYISAPLITILVDKFGYRYEMGAGMICL